MSENKSVFNWTFCQLLTENTNYTKNIWHSAQQLKMMLPLMGRENFNDTSPGFNVALDREKKKG
jgi:hypothetical protein